MANPIDITRLDTAEKLALMESLWDDLRTDDSHVPMPDWHDAILQKRTAALDAAPESALDWDAAKASISDRLS